MRAGVACANSKARANGVYSLRKSAIRISGRRDHLAWWQRALTKAGVAVGRKRAFTMAFSVTRGFSSAACQTRASLSSSKAAGHHCGRAPRQSEALTQSDRSEASH